jgi:hypothetical protein
VFLARQVVGDRGRMNGFSADAGNDVWAVGIPSAGTAAILHFNGTSWSRVASPGFPQGFSAPRAVTALSPTDVWLAGEVKVNKQCCPKGLIEHWDGTSFSVVASPDPKPRTTLSLSGIAAIFADDIWAVGFAVENWNGTSWRIIATPAPAGSQLDGVTALSDGTVVAVAVTTNSSGIASGLIVEN